MSLGGEANTTREISLDQFLAFNDEIVTLVRSGLPLELGLRGISKDYPGDLADISYSLAEQMERGESLPDAVARERAGLPALYRTVVEAGMKAGRLPTALETLSQMAGELLELRRSITLAMLYPLIVVVLAYALFLTFLVHIFGHLESIYIDYRLPIDGALKMVLDVRDSAAMWVWIPPLVIVGIVYWWGRQSAYRFFELSRIQFPLTLIPGLRQIAKYHAQANFTELTALLLESQVPLAETLRIAADATGDDGLRKDVEELATQAERAGIRQEDDHTRLTSIPPLVAWVLRWEVEASARVASLKELGKIYRDQAKSLAAWQRVLLPILCGTIIGGGVVLLYALSMFLPLRDFLMDLTIE